MIADVIADGVNDGSSAHDVYAVHSFEDFWPHYVRLHTRPETHVLHAIATLSCLGLLGAAAVLRQPVLAVAAPLVDFAIAQAQPSHLRGERHDALEEPALAHARRAPHAAPRAHGTDARRGRALQCLRVNPVIRRSVARSARWSACTVESASSVSETSPPTAASWAAAEQAATSTTETEERQAPEETHE